MNKHPLGKTLKVLIINPPATVDRDFIDYPYFANLGALQHASAVAASGYDVEVADSFSLPGSGAFPIGGGRFLVGCEPDELAGIAARSGFDAAVVCLSVFHRPFATDDNLAAFFRAFRKSFPDKPIAAADAYFGGMHYVDYPGEDFLANYPEADALLRYESESAALKWLEDINQGLAPERREYVGKALANFSEAPFPAWDLIDVKEYLGFLDRFMAATGRKADFSAITPVLPVAASRGCLYSCSFCSGTDIPQRRTHRSVSPARLRPFLAGLKDKYGINGIAVLDGLANADAGRFTELLETIRALGLKASFLNGLRADRLEESHIKLLSEISPSLAVSAESASDRIRNGILNKKLDLAAIERTAALCAKYKLPLSIHYMTGAPGETTAEANATLEHAHNMSSAYGAAPLMQFCVPLPGSALHVKLVSEGERTPDPAENYSALFNANRGGAAEGPASSGIGRMLQYFSVRMRESSPEKLIINLTYRCNNKCGMCAVGGRPKTDMPLETCQSLLRDYRARGVEMLDLDGGEPTLHPDFMNIIEYARSLGYSRINVTTNGRKLASRDFSSRLLLGGITELHISIYGPDAETHERVTGIKGSFGETSQGIRNAVRLRPERVAFGANTVVTNSNYKTLPALAEWLAGIGVTALDVQFPTPFGSAQEKHLPPLEEAVGIFEKTVERFGGAMKFNLINLQPCVTPPGWPAARADAEKYGRHMAFVNAPPQSLGAYLASKRRRAPECLDCEYYIICEGFYVFD